MYALDQILKPDFDRSWHEAVALVQEVALALADLPTLPAPEDLLLEEDGTVAIGFASELEGDPVISLATLLLQLLDGIAAPAGLRSLAADNSKTPPAQATVADFTRALGSYESSDRRSDLRAVVARLSARTAAANAERELELLRQRISSSREEDTAPEDDTAKNGTTAVNFRQFRLFHLKLPDFKLPHLKKLPQFSVRQAAIAACIIVALLGTLAVAGLARGRSLRAGEAAPVATLPSEPEAGGGSPTEGPRGTRGQSAVNPALRPLPPQRQTARRPASSSVSVSRAPMRGLAPLALRERPAMIPPVQALPPAPLAAPPKHSPAPTATNTVRLGPAATDSIAALPPLLRAGPVPGHVYSAAEPNVKPARLTHAQLPQEPAPGVDTGYFDIIVDESGDVELVKLLSPTRRYQDRILVAAAKAWKFTPALLNGTPVKYRIRIPIILPDIPR